MTDAASISAYPATIADSCGQFFATCLRAFGPRIPAAARVLEIGCAEYDWLSGAAEAWPAMTITGIDWRGRKRSPASCVVIKGDVLTQRFPPASFDWIVSISAIEHIGLGHYASDPMRADGDVVTLAKCWDWLAPGGWVFFDVPYNPERYQVVGTSHRIYDDAAIQSRFAQGRPWVQAWRGIAGKGDTTALIEPRPRRGGEDFDYIGLWWQKPRGA